MDSRNNVHTQRWHYYRGPVEDVADWSRSSLFFGGSAHKDLVDEVAGYLGVPLSGVSLSRFADTEVGVKVLDTVRGLDAFVLQPICRSFPAASVNDALIELTLFSSALKRASAKSVTAVVPYYGYARGDRRMGDRVPIAAADIAHILTGCGITRLITLDLHAGQIEGFFPSSVALEPLSSMTVAASYFAEQGLHHAVVVSPDAGGVARAKEFRDTMESMGRVIHGSSEELSGQQRLAIIVKQRSGASQIERMDLVGSVVDQDVILVDDIMDTAGTLCKAAEQCKLAGARRVFAFCTHGLFSGPAPRRLAEACAAGHLEYLVVTNSVPQMPAAQWDAACGDLPPPRLKVLSIAPLLAEVMKRIVYKQKLDLTNMRENMMKAVSKL